MALPTTLTNFTMPDQNYYLGPFKSSGGNYYIVGAYSSTGYYASVWKATDPTSSWARSSTTQLLGNAFDSMWSYQDGDTLHIIVQQTANSAVWYHSYDMSSDTWSNSGESVILPVDVPSSMSCSIAVRSDGDLVVLYNGDTDKVKGTPYNRVDYITHEGTAWGDSAGAVDAAGEVDYYGSVIVMGESDKCHFFFKDDTNSDAKHRSFDSGNNLSATENTYTDVTNHLHSYCPSVYYDANGVERIVAGYMGYVDVVTRVLSSLISDDGSPDTAEQMSDSNIASVNNSPIACLAVDGTTVHILFSGTQNDLYHDSNTNDGGWGTDTEFLDAATINRISCNCYERGGSMKLAMVYDNAGTIQYNEIDLYSLDDLTDFEFARQNYYHGPFRVE